MKKHIYFSLIAVSIASLACSKMETADNTVKENTVELKGIISNADGAQEVKTNYDLDASTGTFYWTGTEKIGILNFDGYFWEDAFTSTTPANNKETALVFSGTPSDEGAYQTDFAFYPIWDATAKTGIGWSSSPIFKLYIHDSQAYNAEAPLKDVVPMIAKKDGEGNYAFTPVTAIIEVNVKNLPAAARKITLSSTGAAAALSGYYRITSNPANYASNIEWVMNNGLTVNLAYNDGNTAGVKTITFDSGLGKGEYSFYFPVSVGELPNLTIAFKDGDDNVLQSLSYAKSITTARGNITRLPLMDLAKATSVVLAGTVAAPTAYINRLSPDVVGIKYAIATSADDAKAAATSGTSISAIGSENAFSITPGTDASGLYYLGYVIYDSADNTLGTFAIPFYYLAATEASAYMGQYTIGYSSSSITIPDAAKTLTLAVSDNPAKGNVMLTEFLGIHSDASLNDPAVLTYAVYGTEEASTTISQSGSPIYGTLSGTKITFFDVLNQPLAIDKFGDNVFLHNYYANQPNLAFTLGGTHTLSSDAGTISIAYGATYPSDGAQNYLRVQGLYADLP